MKINVVTKGNAVRTNVGSLGASTVTLIQVDDLNILVDTTHYGRRKLLLEGLARIDVKPDVVNMVILTHLHWDHALNYDLFPDADFLIASEELKYNRQLPESDLFAVRGFHKLIKEYSVKEVNVARHKITNEVELIKAPGHTPGSLIVFAKTENESTIITGDAIPNARSWFRGMPDILTYKEASAIRSFEMIKMISNDPIIIPGHDPPFRIIGNTAHYLEKNDLEVIFREDREKDFVFKFGETESRKNYHT
jgi:glyoxylase-like metal-dependent hydrolase (beta-lactamase superfamily II)